MLYLMLNEGESPETAVPIIATTDALIIAAVAEAFVRKLGAKTPAEVRRLQVKPAPRLTPPPESNEPAAS